MKLRAGYFTIRDLEGNQLNTYIDEVNLQKEEAQKRKLAEQREKQAK